MSSIGGYENNVILGTTQFRRTDDCGEELEKIIGSDKIYIAASLQWMPNYRLENEYGLICEESEFSPKNTDLL